MSGSSYQYRNRRVFVPDGYLVVGQITSAHGLRGEVSVELHTDFPERFQAGTTIYMGDELQPVEIQHARPHKANMLLRFHDVETRDDAERMRGIWLYIEEEDAAPLEDDTYWIHDIIGLQVVSDDGRELGRISDVMSTGANDVYVIQPAPGVNRDRELLLPAVADVIQKVDLETGNMVVSLIPGLLDEDASQPPAI
jgi:16S rRNA processing protein RimM